MKTTIYIMIFIAGLIYSFNTGAQDIDKSLANAGSSYNSGDLENARFSLQEAYNGINQAIGKEVLALLPETLGTMNKSEGTDDVTGTGMGFVAGLYINREYQSENETMSFNIVTDSPLLASINTMLSMSVFMVADPNQKRIKIEGYKALLTRTDGDDGTITFDVQLPFNNSLMSMNFTGINNENEVIKITDKIPVTKIIETVQ